jgi:hypothetical protein
VADDGGEAAVQEFRQTTRAAGRRIEHEILGYFMT